MIEHFSSSSLANLQGIYVSTFDLGKKAGLNLFEHLHGDSAAEVLQCSIFCACMRIMV